MNAQSKCDDLASPPQPAHHCSPAPRVALLGSGRDDAGLARKTLSELPPKKVKSSQIPARLGALSTEACIPLGALSTLRCASHWEHSPQRRASHWERSPHRGVHPTGSTLHTEARIPLGALSTQRCASHWEHSPHGGAHPTGSALHTEACHPTESTLHTEACHPTDSSPQVGVGEQRVGEVGWIQAGKKDQ